MAVDASAFEELDAQQEDMVIVPTGRHAKTARYHRQHEDTMRPACNNFTHDGQLLTRAHARGRQIEPCPNPACFPEALR